MMNEKAEKLLRLMLDPGTGEPEQLAALRGLRRLYVADPSILDNGRSVHAAQAAQQPTIDWRQKLVPFGKYRGMNLGAIADQDPDYIVWLSGWDGLREPMATYVHLAYRDLTPATADNRPDQEYRP